jgi:23S rRNA pseudouridine2604 synthase
MSESIRLNKRVADVVPCSRNDAEAYIAGGWVSVDGVVVEEPGTRVLETQQVALLPGARPDRIEPVTIVLHKPAGVAAHGALLTAAAQHGNARVLRCHFHQLELAAPLDDRAAGMVVFSQDYRVLRKLREDAPENELLVSVTGALAEGGMAQLNQGMKVSWQSEGRLRFATKVFKPGLIERVCADAGLKVTELRRIRIGRLPLAQLPVGQWRYLQPAERF